MIIQLKDLDSVYSNSTDHGLLKYNTKQYRDSSSTDYLNTVQNSTEIAVARTT